MGKLRSKIMSARLGRFFCGASEPEVDSPRSTESGWLDPAPAQVVLSDLQETIEANSDMLVLQGTKLHKYMERLAKLKQIYRLRTHLSIKMAEDAGWKGLRSEGSTEDAALLKRMDALRIPGEEDIVKEEEENLRWAGEETVESEHVDVLHTAPRSMPLAQAEEEDTSGVLCSNQGFNPREPPTCSKTIEAIQVAPQVEPPKEKLQVLGGAEPGKSARVEASTDDGPGQQTLDAIVDGVSALWTFLTPHTIVVMLSSSIFMVASTLMENSSLVDWHLLPTALLGFLALLCGNGSIMGINHLLGVKSEETQVNKPFQPFEVKTWSPLTIWLLILCFVVTGVSITARNFGPFITFIYVLALVLGTVYNFTLFQQIKFAIPISFTLAVVRGFLLNFGVFYAAKATLGIDFEWSPAAKVIALFATVLTLVHAVVKDVPDTKEKKHLKFGTPA